MKCKFPIMINEYESFNGEKKRRVARLHLACAYYNMASNNCECPYDECAMDYTIQLEGGKING